MSEEKDTQMVCNVMGEVLARIDEMVREEGEHDYRLDFDRLLARVRRAVDDARLWRAHERERADQVLRERLEQDLWACGRVGPSAIAPEAGLTVRMEEPVLDPDAKLEISAERLAESAGVVRYSSHGTVMGGAAGRPGKVQPPKFKLGDIVRIKERPFSYCGKPCETGIVTELAVDACLVKFENIPVSAWYDFQSLEHITQSESVDGRISEQKEETAAELMARVGGAVGVDCQSVEPMSASTFQVGDRVKIVGWDFYGSGPIGGIGIVTNLAEDACRVKFENGPFSRWYRCQSLERVPDAEPVKDPGSEQVVSTPATPEFKVGDRVRVVAPGPTDGKIGTIKCVYPLAGQDHSAIEVVVDGDSTEFYYCEDIDTLELVASAPVPDPPVGPPAQPEFKVGDRVRVVNTKGYNIPGAQSKLGLIGTVISTNNCILVNFCAGDEWYYYPYNLEHVAASDPVEPPPEPPQPSAKPEFKVGDRVKVLEPGRNEGKFGTIKFVYIKILGTRDAVEVIIDNGLLKHSFLQWTDQLELVG